MNMFASAKTMTRGDLRKAFDDYAEAHGHEQATLALERSTGVHDVSAVPADRIISGMVELVVCYSFVGRAPPTKRRPAADSLADVHSALSAIRDQAYARMQP